MTLLNVTLQMERGETNSNSFVKRKKYSWFITDLGNVVKKNQWNEKLIKKK